MDDILPDGAVTAPAPHDPDRYARIARLVNEALRAANLASLEPDPSASAADEETGLLELPSRVPWLDVVADLAIAAGYLADVPADPPPVLKPASEHGDSGQQEPERSCLAAIRAAAGTLDALSGPRAHRDVMVRIALTGALRSAQAADRRP